MGHRAAENVEESHSMSEASLHGASSEELRVRGTGNYTCPQGLSCRKGGLHKDGTIRVFSRNSDFRYSFISLS